MTSPSQINAVALELMARNSTSEFLNGLRRLRDLGWIIRPPEMDGNIGAIVDGILNGGDHLGPGHSSHDGDKDSLDG